MRKGVTSGERLVTRPVKEDIKCYNTMVRRPKGVMEVKEVLSIKIMIEKRATAPFHARLKG